MPITTGKFQLRKKDVSLADVIQVAVDSSRPAVAEHGHALEIDLPRRPMWVHADPNRLAQVFSNLLDNAVKYTPAGGRIEVGATVDDHVARVSVADSGIGIPADQLDLVFEKFVQIDRPQERGHARASTDDGGWTAAVRRPRARGSPFSASRPASVLRPQATAVARTAGFSTIGRLISAESTPNRMASHHTAS